jgi:hypothetical protein
MPHPTLHCTQARVAIPAAIKGRHSQRLAALTAAIQEEGEGASSAAAGKGGKGGRGRRASAVEGSSSSSAVQASDKHTADAIKTQARELKESLAANSQALPNLEKAAQNVLGVLEKQKKK